MSSNPPFGWPQSNALAAQPTIDDILDRFGVKAQLAAAELTSAQRNGLYGLVRDQAAYHEHRGATPLEA